MDRPTHDPVTPAPAATPAAPPTAAQAKARLRAAAEACDPAPWIKAHPFLAVAGATVLGFASGQTSRISRLLLTGLELYLGLSREKPK